MRDRLNLRNNFQSRKEQKCLEHFFRNRLYLFWTLGEILSEILVHTIFLLIPEVFGVTKQPKMVYFLTPSYGTPCSSPH